MNIGIGVGIRRHQGSSVLKPGILVPGFVGGWTGYGRSNGDTDRDILPDKSGNGRDIRLYNFSFSGMSGFGGYSTRFNDGSVWSIGLYATKVLATSFGIYAENSNGHAALYTSNAVSFRAKVSNISGTNTRLEFGNGSISESSSSIKEDGIYSFKSSGEVPYGFKLYPLEGGATIPTPIIVELLPEYPGALVSDGVDDYGLCIKDFTLPDDYTVCALRRRLGGTACLAAKSRDKANGAFIFEYDDSRVNYSYGQVNQVTDYPPALFSYQTKESFNGQTLNVGLGTDTESDELLLFAVSRISLNKFLSCALYELRIYDRSLTEEQLQIVKDEMMLNYEKYANPLAGITYVADWDAKSRSNDESADTRGKWVDKARGKVMNLHGFDWTKESGWNDGALVSDGIDDYCVTSDAINEDVGTVLVHGRFLNEPNGKIEQIYRTGFVTDRELNAHRWNKIFQLMLPSVERDATKINDIIQFLRTPVNPNAKLYLFQYDPNNEFEEITYCAFELKRLIFIREKLDDLQLEFIKWKIDYEHRAGDTKAPSV